MDFTPDGWAFSIWGIIYIWIGASIIFGNYKKFGYNFISNFNFNSNFDFNSIYSILISILKIEILISNFSVICTIFKKNNDGFRLYNFNPVFDLIVCFIISLNFALNITWLFVWDREDLVTSCAVLVFMALTNATTVWLLAKNIASNNHELLRTNKKLYM